MAEATIPLYLGLGSNMGDRASNLNSALAKLDRELGVHRTGLSDFIETEPWGFESPDKFLNAVVRYDIKIPIPKNYSVESDKDENSPAGTASQDDRSVAVSVPSGREEDRLYSKEETAGLTEAAHRILEICKKIEREMGRDEVPEYDSAGRRIYHSRIIDIDILLLGDFRIDEPDLKIPHPQITSRPFVLIPLRQLAPELKND